MTSTISACPISSYKFYQESGYTTTFPNTYSSSPGMYRYKFSSYVKLIINISGGSVSWWFTAVFADGSEKQVDYLGNKEFKAVVCDITQGSFPSSYTNLQYVQASDADPAQTTHFVLPAYSSTCSSETITRTSTVTTVGNPVETTTGSGIYKVVPTSISTT